MTYINQRKRKRNPFLKPMLVWVLIGAVGSLTVSFTLNTNWGLLFYLPYVVFLILSIVWSGKR